MNRKVETEWKRRNLALEDFGLDTKGFGLLNTFFLYDEVTGYFGWFAKKALDLGWNKLAFFISGVSISQFKKEGLEIRQTVIINGATGSYRQECYIHDDDPEKAESYVLEKYRQLQA